VPREHDEAEITFFVLVASTTKDPEGYSAFKLPDGSVVSREKTLGFLRALSRPVICEGRKEEQCLVLETNEIKGADRGAHLEHADSQFAFFRGHFEGESVPNSSDANRLLVLTGPQGEMDITLAKLHTWLREYFIPNRTLSFVREVEPDLSRRNTTVVRVGPGGGVSSTRLW
jgi:hypothetical protein